MNTEIDEMIMDGFDITITWDCEYRMFVARATNVLYGSTYEVYGHTAEDAINTLYERVNEG